MQGRVIAIGASADGIETIGRILGGLPADFAAPVLVVQHIGRRSPGYLPQILRRAGRLPVLHPPDGLRITPGVVYVAPPNQHMLVRAGAIHLSHGPEENHCRPAVDALFRSVAIAYGAAAVGVVLTGYLADGAAGLAAIKDRGGVAIVQDPEDAGAPSMPVNALARVPADRVLPADRIADALVELVADAPGPDLAVDGLALEDRIAGGEAAALHRHRLVDTSTPTDRACPRCGGRLLLLPEPRFARYRCRTGHAFTEWSLGPTTSWLGESWPSHCNRGRA